MTRPVDPPTRFKRKELKIVLRPDEALRVRLWAADRLTPDKFGSEDGGYLVHSLYLDSPRLDIYNRSGGEDGTKYRIRRYGAEDLVWLERKRRRGESVTKRRGRWPLERIDEILESGSTPSGFAGEFKDTVRSRRYAPRVLVSYPRFAWSAGVDARLTMDFGVDARLPDRVDPFSLSATPARVSDDVVLELKYDLERPAVFDDLLRYLGRDSGSFSKYGRGVETLGLVIVSGPRAGTIAGSGAAAPSGDAALPASPA